MKVTQPNLISLPDIVPSGDALALIPIRRTSEARGPSSRARTTELVQLPGCFRVVYHFA